MITNIMVTFSHAKKFQSGFLKSNLNFSIYTQLSETHIAGPQANKLRISDGTCLILISQELCEDSPNVTSLHRPSLISLWIFIEYV